LKTEKKREQILDAMQELMANSELAAISVSKIAEKANMGKGSIYYYFSSKNDIIAAVIERSYSRVLEKAEHLLEKTELSCSEKMEQLYYACINAASELHHQEEQLTTYQDMQNSAFIHREFTRVNLTKLTPVLADIFKQGTEEGTFHCDTPEETAYLVLLVLTSILDQNPIPLESQRQEHLLQAFIHMQEKSLGMPKSSLNFLLHPITSKSRDSKD